MFNKNKLIVLRNNIDAYLQRVNDKDGKNGKDGKKNKALDQNKLIVLRNNIDAYIHSLDEKEDRSKVFLESLIKLKKEIKESVLNVNVIVKAIERIGALIANQPKGVSLDPELLRTLKKIELNLSSKKTSVSFPKDRTDEIIKAIKEIEIKVPEIEFPTSVNIDNWPPQKVPQPVTHININSLKGVVHSTTTTVSTTLTQLPGYGELDSRRSIIFYNNDGTNIVYIGGSTVTSSNGLPIEAKSFSPSFDSGPLQKWYGITSAGTADVRCIEIADEAAGR